MRSEQLTDNQLQALAERLRPMLGYLSRLQARMAQQGFSADDRLVVLVGAAQQAMQALTVELHYLSCDGTGRQRSNRSEGMSPKRR
jgi:hypothetical protein